MFKRIAINLTLLCILSILVVFFSTCEKNPDEELILDTKGATGISYIFATSGGTLDDRGHPGEWDITEKGVCWSKTNQLPTIDDNRTIDGSGGGNFTSFLLPLEPNTEYYYRAYAIYKGTPVYSLGGFGASSFRTLAFDSIYFNQNLIYGTVTDIENNSYKTIQIGTQEWMAENLKVTKYNNGVTIPNISDNYDWNKSTSDAYCNYQNVESFSTFYGRIYNWNAANSTNQICPSGWHVPTDSDWKILEQSLGMSQFQVDSSDWRGSNEGLKLKSTNLWKESYGINNNNSSGFSAIPDEIRNSNGTFGINGYYGGWWTNTEYDESNAWYRGLSNSKKTVQRKPVKKISGNAIRCVKNN